LSGDRKPPAPINAILAFCLMYPCTLLLEGCLGVLTVGSALLTLGIVGLSALVVHIALGGKV
jgi:hypothetical protein